MGYSTTFIEDIETSKWLWYEGGGESSKSPASLIFSFFSVNDFHSTAFQQTIAGPRNGPCYIICNCSNSEILNLKFPFSNQNPPPSISFTRMWKIPINFFSPFVQLLSNITSVGCTLGWKFKEALTFTVMQVQGIYNVSWCITWISHHYTELSWILALLSTSLAKPVVDPSNCSMSLPCNWVWLSKWNIIADEGQYKLLILTLGQPLTLPAIFLHICRRLLFLFPAAVWQILLVVNSINTHFRP